MARQHTGCEDAFSRRQFLAGTGGALIGIGAALPSSGLMSGIVLPPFTDTVSALVLLEFGDFRRSVFIEV